MQSANHARPTIVVLIERITMKYTLLRTFFGFGKLNVQYACPKCGESLLSPIAEAGTTDTCPGCSTQFEVPGLSDRLRIEKENQERDQAKQQARDRREQARAERERELMLQRQRREAELRSAAEAEIADGESSTILLRGPGEFALM